MAAQEASAATESGTAAKPGRALNIALWVLQGLLGLVFVVAGGGKLLGAEANVEMFEIIGWGQWFRYLTGAVEVAGGIALLIPLLSGLAALGLVATMLGAAFFDVVVLDVPPVASLTLMVLVLVVAWGRRGRITELTRRVGVGGGRE